MFETVLMRRKDRVPKYDLEKDSLVDKLKNALSEQAFSTEIADCFNAGELRTTPSQPAGSTCMRHDSCIWIMGQTTRRHADRPASQVMTWPS